jgi:excisionase family DNA binding protein
MTVAVQTPEQQPVRRRYFSLSDAEAYTGLSVQTLRRLARAGRLQVYRPSPKRVVVDREELDRLILSSVKPA